MSHRMVDGAEIYAEFDSTGMLVFIQKRDSPFCNRLVAARIAEIVGRIRYGQPTRFRAVTASTHQKNLITIGRVTIRVAILVIAEVGGQAIETAEGPRHILKAGRSGEGVEVPLDLVTRATMKRGIRESTQRTSHHSRLLDIVVHNTYMRRKMIIFHPM